ncbi:hypothetical protein [uncultured Microscilla sp.]|uniref:hypothetical protein n=1 Tax=uncultured Microscilla sp. TaxID=432653 RepID=UPI00260E3973|nr:hypothetical protein [uncultured Microscilla sp.]
MSSKNISYVLIIRRILFLTTGVLFAILFFRAAFGVGSYGSLLSETFRLNLLTEKGPLISKPFRVYEKTKYYEMNFDKNTSEFTGDSLLINVKVLNNKDEVINEFTESFIVTNKSGYRDKWHKRLFKVNKDQELRVAMKVIKNNLKKSKRNYVRFKVRYANKKVPTSYYYKVFIYAFFAMIVMLFIPKKWF